MAQRTSNRRDSVNQSLEQKQKDKEKNLALSQEKEKEKEKEYRLRSDKPVQFDKEFNSFKGEIKDLFKEFDQRVEQRLRKIDDKFSKVFDDLKREMGSMRTELYDTKAEMQELKSKVNSMEESVMFHTDRQEQIEDRNSDKINHVADEMKELNNKLLLLEKHDRKYNLLFYGFPEKADENVVETMKAFFKDKLKIEEKYVQNMNFSNCHRMPYDGEGPKPIIVRFMSFGDRETVLSKSLMPILREERKRILTDLPIEMKRRRGKLAKEAYKIRKGELLKTRIIEQGLSVHLEVRKNNQESWVRRDVD